MSNHEGFQNPSHPSAPSFFEVHHEKFFLRRRGRLAHGDCDFMLDELNELDVPTIVNVVIFKGVKRRP